jgi:hypothetical protein
MIRLIDLEVYKKLYKSVIRFGRPWINGIILIKIHLGKQFVKAADSMALNIAEGYGRFFL